MSWLERAMVKKVAGVTSDVSKVRNPEIIVLAHQLTGGTEKVVSWPALKFKARESEPV